MQEKYVKQKRDISYSYFIFFFQAEDGIRDLTVTGVQTCALPISSTPCRDNWTEARATPEAVEGSAMLSSPAEAVTGIAISSSSTERPECESSAERDRKSVV